MADTKGTPSNGSELYDYDDKNNNDGFFEFEESIEMMNRNRLQR